MAVARETAWLMARAWASLCVPLSFHMQSFVGIYMVISEILAGSRGLVTWLTFTLPTLTVNLRMSEKYPQSIETTTQSQLTPSVGRICLSESPENSNHKNLGPTPTTALESQGLVSWNLVLVSESSPPHPHDSDLGNTATKNLKKQSSSPLG